MLKGYMKLTDEKIISMYKAGYSLEDIWDTYYIPVKMIRKILTKNGIHIREDI